jgi:hypothetical protein
MLLRFDDLCRFHLFGNVERYVQHMFDAAVCIAVEDGAVGLKPPVRAVLVPHAIGEFNNRLVVVPLFRAGCILPAPGYFFA